MAADPASPIPTEVSSISFSFLTAEQVRRISVKQITNPVLFDALNNPTIGGLYDPALGPTSRGDICQTCRLTSFDCPGHFGHIDLPAPVFHPLFITQVYNLLRGSCQHCHHFLVTPATVSLYSARLMLLERGLAADADNMASEYMKTAKQLASHKRDNIEEQGDDTGAETLSEYRERLRKMVDVAVKRERHATGATPTRDAFKDQICFAKRKALIAEFLKLLTTKRRCTRCNAHHNRMRKEGHTKIVAYSLTQKQQMQDELVGIQRENVLLRAASAASAALKKKAKSRSRDAISAKELRHDSDAESEQGYNQDEVDSDADSLEPEGPNGRAPTPTSSADGDDGSDGTSDTSVNDDTEAVEDNNAFHHMTVDEEDQAELGADIAGVEVERPEEAQKAATAAAAASSGRTKQTERIMTAQECREHIRRLFENETEICRLIYGSHGPVPTRHELDAQNHNKNAPPAPVSGDIFFLDVVTVPPSRFRPPASMGEMTFESPQSDLLTSVLKAVITIRDRNEALRQARTKRHPPASGAPTPTPDPIRLYAQLIEAVINLQIAVNSFMDSTKNPAPLRGGKEPPMGVKQVLEKKEGLFRKNMMGKRVNYAARSVISPDVNIETNEIGVPPVFAKKLTFPEPVTPHNVARMRQLVCNGPNVHPGAAFIQLEDGSLMSLAKKTDQERSSIAAQLLTPSGPVSHPHGRPDIGLPSTRTPVLNRKVYRHLDDGDILILNRQPTLHKPSMMCHRAKVLKGEKTIRMHYANCNSYNADFDGDEMNMHFPQSHIAQAEAKLIADTDSQYLVPTSGSPLRGLIQDHVVAGTWMTNKDIFFTRDEYYQLIYGALRSDTATYGTGRVLTVPPAIWKPRPMWTGKQIITTIMKNVTPEGAHGLHMSSKSKVPGDAWGAAHKEEGFVLFYDGYMISGCLDKSQFGATAYGLVHSCYELYGKATAGQLLGILSRLFTNYLQHRAFSCRMDDLILTPEGNASRAKLIKEADRRGHLAALSVVGLDKEDPDSADTMHNLKTRLEQVLRDDNKLAGLDAIVSARMGELSSLVIKETLPGGLVKPFPHNNMQTMTISGAKGSNVNASQISSLLGQQSLEGRRVPVMVSGKTLPSFKAFETAPRAGGYVAQRFLTGIRPQEYYFHCMAGREGLIDTAVKTSRSGYLQRCLIKHLEGIKVNYDNTVRNADGSVIQFNYGEDSLDVTKQKSLSQFEFAARNYRTLVNRYQPTTLAGKLNEEDAGVHMKATLKRVAKAPLTSTGFPDLTGLPDPTLAVLSPTSYLGCTSEAYALKLGEYMSSNPQRLLKGKKKDRAKWHEWQTLAKDKLVDPVYFNLLMNLRYMRSLVDAGEAVGLLASQGVGEPSTQMTLNTFHFAGHGAANVTLGIPRLREIVMTASATIKTPTMRLQIRPEVSERQVVQFCKSASKVTLSQVVEEVTVDQRLSSKTAENAYSRETIYTVKLKFYPREEYEEEFRTTPEEILRSFDKAFCPLFDKEILKALKTASKGAKLSDVGKAQKGDGHRRTETGEDVDGGDAVGTVEDEMAAGRRNDEEEVDMDADDARRAAQGHQQATYGEADSDDEEADAAALPMDTAALEAAYASESDNEGDGSSVASDDIDEAGDATSKKEVKLAKADRLESMRRIENAIPGRSKFVQKVDFDKEGGQWCNLELQFAAHTPKLLLVGIVEACCRHAVVHQAPGITRCFEAAPEAGAKADDPKFCVTEGVNLAGAWSFADGIVDLNSIYTNDIAAVLRTYGVEAARTVLIKEIQAVFGVYGIGVDRRHLSLIADYMTSEGGYKPFNRTGLANSPSPFLKASFETTAGFIADATLFGDFEDLTSPAASVVMGKPAQTGTGIFQIALPVAARA